MNKREKNDIRFAICVAGDHPRLELRKVYRVLRDPVAEAIRWIRVVDESQEDYVYPEKNFVFVELPQKAQHSIPSAKKSAAPQWTSRQPSLTHHKSTRLKRVS